MIVSCSVFTLWYLPTNPYWKPKEGLFIVFALLLIASCWLSKKTERYSFNNRWLPLIFIYTAVMFGWNFIWPLINSSQTLHLSYEGIKYTLPLIVPKIWFTLLPTFNLLLALFLIYHLIEHTDFIAKWLDIIKVVCWVGFGLAVLAILQYFGCAQIIPKAVGNYEGITEGRLYHMYTFMGNKMLSSNIIASITPLFLIFKTKKYYLAMLVCLASLLFFRSVFNIGVAVIGIGVVLLLQGRWKLTLCLMISVLSLLLIFKDKTNFNKVAGNFGGRITLYREVFAETKDTFLFGKGLGSLRRDFTINGEEGRRFHSSHNLFIDILYELGLVGLFLAVGYLLNLFRRVRQVFANRNQSMLLIGLCGGFVSYLIMAQTSFPHFIAPLALLGIIYMAGIEIHLSKRRIV